MSVKFVTLSSLFIFFLVFNYIEATTYTPQVNVSNEMVPMKFSEMRMMMNESRRKLSGFQICGTCTCCGGSKGVCLLSPCCYAINCNIPNRPFGFCSFTPKTCNCLGCHY